MSDRRKIFELFEEHKDFYEKTVAEGIEKNRKGDVKIRVVDKDGKPLKGVRVHAKQKTHAFRFGANLFMLDELETPEKNAAYKRLFADVFNMATLPFYWDTLEPERGKPRYAKDSPKVYRRPSPDLCLAYCKEHGIAHEEVVYIGDDYGRGGNDESVYRSDFNYLTIDDYRDFPRVVAPLLS